MSRGLNALVTRRPMPGHARRARYVANLLEERRLSRTSGASQASAADWRMGRGRLLTIAPGWRRGSFGGWEALSLRSPRSWRWALDRPALVGSPSPPPTRWAS